MVTASHSSIKDFFKPIDKKDKEKETVDLLSSDSAMSGFKKKVPRVLEIVDSDEEHEQASPCKTKKKAKVEEVITEAHAASSPSTTHGAKKFNYGDYLRRKQQGPLAPGSKEIPQGSPNCLEGLTFVFTGELSSISRDDAADLVKRYGARVTSAPSHKTSFLVVGEGAGDSKLAKAHECSLAVLDEDGLFDLIKSKSTIVTSSSAEPPAKKVAEKPNQKDFEDEVYEEKTVRSIFISPELITTKYAPKSEEDLIGNATPFKNLVDWLSSWKDHPQAKHEFNAVLISGPPGIGKTTTAHLACEQAGFDKMELNASDTRSKKALDERIRDILNNTSLIGGIKTRRAASRMQAFIMDECDGMSAGDRGGIAELIQLIKKTKSPIICICNDRANPKVRNLANYCLDLKFRRPDARQIVPRIKMIAEKEGLRLDPNVIEELVSSTQGDVRQILNALGAHALTQRHMTFDESKAVYGKDIDQGAFDAAATLLSSGFDRCKTMSEKLELFFVDDSLMSLMIQARASSWRKFRGGPGQNDQSYMDYWTEAADSISQAEELSNLIRGANQEWWLSPAYGLMSTVLPAYYCHGGMSGRLDFPAWFGSNSKLQKHVRIAKTLSKHTFLKLSMHWQVFMTQLVPVMTKSIIEPLVTRGNEGIETAIAVLDEYCLSKEDLDEMIELVSSGDDSYTVMWSKIPAAVKSAFTRKYNASGHKLPYSLDQSSAPVKRVIVDFIEPGEEDEADKIPDYELEDEEDVGLEKNKMIKVKTTAPKKRAASKK